MFNSHVIKNPEIIITRKDFRVVVAKADILVEGNDEDAILRDNVIADFFDDLGQHMSILYSDSARFNQKNNNLYAMGNVFVVSDSGYTLSTKSIMWDNQYKLIESQDSVMFTTPEKDTMYGIGFESDMDLSEWKIYKPKGVSGKGF